VTWKKKKKKKHHGCYMVGPRCTPCAGCGHLQSITEQRDLPGNLRLSGRHPLISSARLPAFEAIVIETRVRNMIRSEPAFGKGMKPVGKYDGLFLDDIPP